MKRMQFSLAAGTLLALLGGIVILGWWMQFSSLVRVLPGFTPMVFNTALSFVLAGVAAQTAAGLLVLAVGLRSAWGRSGWGRVPLFARDDDRITFVGATVLAGIALAAGVASFAILQGRIQTVVGENVLTALLRRIE